MEERYARTLTDGLLHVNLAVGGIAVCVLLGTYAVFDAAPDAALLVLAFCGTFGVYQVERGLGWAPEDRYNHPRRHGWSRRHRRLVVASLAMAAFVAGAVVPLLRPETVALCVGLAAVGTLYAVPVPPLRRRLKAVWYLKPALVAGAWAVGGVVVPLVEAGRTPGGEVVLFTAYRLLFILPNPLVADWLDRAGDARAGLRTVATEWPEPHLRRLAVWSALAAAFGAAGGTAFLDAGALLIVDGAGALGMAWFARRPAALPRGRYLAVLDALVAWPAVTALAWWLI